MEKAKTKFDCQEKDCKYSARDAYNLSRHMERAHPVAGPIRMDRKKERHSPMKPQPSGGTAVTSPAVSVAVTSTATVATVVDTVATPTTSVAAAVGTEQQSMDKKESGPETAAVTMNGAEWNKRCVAAHMARQSAKKATSEFAQAMENGSLLPEQEWARLAEQAGEFSTLTDTQRKDVAKENWQKEQRRLLQESLDAAERNRVYYAAKAEAEAAAKALRK